MYTVWVQNESWETGTIKAYTFTTEGNVIKVINNWWDAFSKANKGTRIINIHPSLGSPGLNG